MNLNEYQIEAAKFAQFPNDPLLGYITIAIMGEAGEVANVYKKELRSGIKQTDKMQDELGDIWWYLNAMVIEFKDERISLQSLYQSTIGNYTIDHIAYEMWPAVHKLLNEALRLDDANHRYGFSAATLYTYCRSVLSVVLWIMSHYELSIEEVLVYNLEKLSQRKATGTIKNHE